MSYGEMQKTRTIQIPYSPREWSVPFHSTSKRWIVLVVHRRAGKTTAALNHLQRSALTVPNSRYAYIAPTYKQAKNVAWDLLKFYSQPIPRVDYNEAELTVRYPNGSRITLYGADNPDSLRGIGLWGVVFDEYSQQPSNIFSEIIRPALADHSGYAIWIGTPKGKNEFWKLYDQAQKDDKWFASLLNYKATRAVEEEEVEDSRRVMTDDEFEQEWNCSFEAAIRGAYYVKELAKARADKRITDVPYDEELQVHTFWDLGIGDSTAILFMQYDGAKWRLIDSYENSGEGLGHYIKVLKDKGYNYGTHYAPHDIEVRELGSGHSRRETASSLGIDFEVAPNLSVEDGINAARLRFSQLWIDQRNNDRFLHCISLYRKEWDDKRGAFKNKPLHDFTSHYADAFRYWAVTKIEGRNEVYQYQPSWVSKKR
jgi:phage terminase large subunit